MSPWNDLETGHGGRAPLRPTRYVDIVNNGPGLWGRFRRARFCRPTATKFPDHREGMAYTVDSDTGERMRWYHYILDFFRGVASIFKGHNPHDGDPNWPPPPATGGLVYPHGSGLGEAFRRLNVSAEEAAGAMQQLSAGIATTTTGRTRMSRYDRILDNAGFSPEGDVLYWRGRPAREIEGTERAEMNAYLRSEGLEYDRTNDRVYRVSEVALSTIGNPVPETVTINREELVASTNLSDNVLPPDVHEVIEQILTREAQRMSDDLDNAILSHLENIQNESLRDESVRNVRNIMQGNDVNTNAPIGSAPWRADFFRRLCESIVRNWANEINFNWIAFDELMVGNYTHVKDGHMNYLSIDNSPTTLHLSRYSGPTVGDEGYVFLRPLIENRDGDYDKGLVFRIAMRSTFPDARLNKEFKAIKIIHRDIIELWHFGDALEETLTTLLQEQIVRPFWDSIAHLVPQRVQNSRATSMRRYKTRRKQRQLDLGLITRGTDNGK